MFTKKELQQLQSLTLEELQAHKAEAVKAKEELEVLKASKKKTWTDAQQDELNDIVLYIVDIEDTIDEKNTAKQVEKPAYIPAKGTEKLVHLKIVKGRRFNPMTGKEISEPYTQVFTFGEWQLFKEHHKGLGYSILEVLYDPYGEAKNYIDK